MILEANTAIKVLAVPGDGSIRSCHVGIYKWDPPKLNDDGSWTPSAWTEPVVPKICYRGYHLTDDPSKWWNRNGRAYLAEYKGVVSGSFSDSQDRKISVESCRLLRPLTAAELAEFNIFIEGEHRVVGDARVFAYGDTVVYADGNAIVHAYNNAKVYANGNAIVHAVGNAVVYADGDTVVFAYGDTVVFAYGDTVVFANGNAKVYANDDTVVFAYGDAKVYAYGNAVVYANDDTVVFAYGDAKVYANGNARVFANGNAKVYANGNAVVYAYGDVVVEASPRHRGTITRS